MKRKLISFALSFIIAIIFPTVSKIEALNISILDSFPSPATRPAGMVWKDNNLWHLEGNGDFL